MLTDFTKRLPAVPALIRALCVFFAILIMAAPVKNAIADALKDAETGEKAHQAGDLNKAIELYTKAIDSGELSRADLAGIYNNRGQARRIKGDLDAALSDHNQALAINPKFYLAYNSRGIVWEKKGDLKRALADFNKAIELSPDYPSAYYNRSGLYERMGRLDDALADIKRFIQLAPDHPWGKNRLRELSDKIKAKK